MTTRPQAPAVTAHAANSPALWAAGIFLFIVYLLSCFSPALLDDADATHAEAAREMAATGDFVTLKVNGIRYLEKAPLMYWAVAVSYRIFGENEFATRLPLLLATVGVSALAFVWGRRAFGARAGLYAALFLPAALGFYLFTRILIPEVILTLWIGLALYCFVMGLTDGRAHWWYSGYVAVALGVLTKGLVAGVFFAGPAVIYLLLSGEWRRWREFRIVTGTLLFLVVAVPWHILAGLRNQGFFWFYFVNEHFLRFLGKRYPKDYNKLPALVYWLMHLAWIFPWSLQLPLVLRDWKGLRPPQPTFESRSRLLLWITTGFILLFFAFSTNQEYYTFPVYFPACLLIADAMARAESTGDRYLRGAHWLFAVIGVAAAVPLALGLWGSRHLPFVSDIGTVLARRSVGDYTLSMSHFFDLTGEAFAALRLPAGIALVALVIGPIIAVVLRRRGSHQGSTAAVVMTLATFLFAAHIALERFEPFLSSRAFARAVATELQQDDVIYIYGDQAFGSSLLFYLKRPIHLLNGRSTSMEFGSRFPDAPRIFHDETQFMANWSSERRVYLFVPRERRDDAGRLLGGSGRVVLELSGKAMMVNR